MIHLEPIHEKAKPSLPPHRKPGVDLLPKPVAPVVVEEKQFVVNEPPAEIKTFNTLLATFQKHAFERPKSKNMEVNAFFQEILPNLDGQVKQMNEAVLAFQPHDAPKIAKLVDNMRRYQNYVEQNLKFLKIYPDKTVDRESKSEDQKYAELILSYMQGFQEVLGKFAQSQSK